ncbi:SNase-domain-containing protein [Acaromyces ingoldii]|uniref:SNase-domain-containing protein n=1 Tax=Acaromyces ingoldii TaxID=215250 RepID=A0A316YVS3_9BASI|nr:SNase-domain-containing protein [Acaromyces ingoldii]PWN93547.1 SNase-domain-containing protein [Acaromyces ingoldii]
MTAQAALNEVKEEAKSLSSTILASPALVALSTLVCGGASYGIYWRYLRRIPTAAHLTPTTLRWRRTLVGRCTSVGDADGFRLYHTPGPVLLRDILYPVPSSSKATRKGRQLHSDETISIRLAGADAPEAAHFGNVAQPFSKEAHDELRRLVLGRTVWCEVAHVDQYGRLVATPYVLRWPYVLGRTNVSLYLVKKGLASVYSQAGAAYGTAGPLAKLVRRLARLRRAQERAKRKRLGMWSQKHVETPEEYKKRTREARQQQ